VFWGGSSFHNSRSFFAHSVPSLSPDSPPKNCSSLDYITTCCMLLFLLLSLLPLDRQSISPFNNPQYWNLCLSPSAWYACSSVVGRIWLCLIFCAVAPNVSWFWKVSYSKNSKLTWVSFNKLSL